MKTVIGLLLCMLLSVPVLADAPLNGTYKTTDLGGTMLMGRYSESWAAGAKLDVDNTMDESSWDGATLAGQWWWYCPRAVSVVLLLNSVDGAGNGQRIWRVSYVGGVMWFDGAGPWGNGDASYTADINTWTAIVTEQFSAFAEVGQVRSISATATFRNYNDGCVNLQVSNTEKIGDTDGGALPADYPDFLDGYSCSAAGGAGEWGSVSQVTFTVSGCETVPVEAVNWGQVKSRYSE